MSSPTHYLKSNPTDKTVTFAGEFIDLRALATGEQLDHTYLSKIFSATCPNLPSIGYGMALAAALGMDYPDFIEQLLEKKQSVLA